MSSTLSDIVTVVNDIKDQFIRAKSDGKLESSEVVAIAVDAAKKIYAFRTISPAEKSSLVALVLKKGLAAAGGLSGLADLSGAGVAALEAVEKQVLEGALTAVQLMLSQAPHLFSAVSWLRSLLSSVRPYLSGCLPACSQVAAVARAIDPKSSAVMEEILGVAQKAQGAFETVESTLKSVEIDLSGGVQKVEALQNKLRDATDTPVLKIVEKEPSLEASLPEVPVHPFEVAAEPEVQTQKA